MLGSIIGGFVVILVGVALFPMIQEQVTLLSISNSSNLTGAPETILGLATLFFALAIATVAISIVFGGLRNAGVLGGKRDSEEDSDDDEDDEEEEEFEFICEHCDREINEPQKHHSGECDECGEEPLCDDCLVMSEEVSICKECFKEMGKKKPKSNLNEYKIEENVLILKKQKKTKKIQLPSTKIKEDKIVRSKYD